MRYTIITFLSIITFVSCSSEIEKKKEEAKPSAVKYQLATVEEGGVSSTIKLPAQLMAFQEVSIFPKANGYVKKVFVDIGSTVSQGTTLMTLEAPELEQASLQAKEKYLRTKADFSIDKERYSRLLEAAKTPGAISPLDISTIKAKMDADSALCNAEKANWQIQQTMLSYLKVTAPFDGVITERNVHPGALVSASSKDKPMLELKQVAYLRLQVDVPENISANIKEKDTVSFYVSALQGKKITGIVNRKSMSVNAQYRSERVEIDVKNKDGLLSSGMYADVVLYSKGNIKALYVPKSSIVTSTERKYVLAVRNGKTVKVDVTTGNVAIDKVEVYGLLKQGEKVVTNTNDEMQEGIEVGDNAIKEKLL